MKSVKTSGVRGSEVESEWREKEQRVDDNRDGRDEYPDLFPNKVAIWFLEQFLRINAKRPQDAGELVGSIV